MLGCQEISNFYAEVPTSDGDVSERPGGRPERALLGQFEQQDKS